MNAVLISKCQVPIFETEPNDMTTIVLKKECMLQLNMCFFWVRFSLLFWTRREHIKSPKSCAHNKPLSFRKALPLNNMQRSSVFRSIHGVFPFEVNDER